MVKTCFLSGTRSHDVRHFRIVSAVISSTDESPAYPALSDKEVDPARFELNLFISFEPSNAKASGKASNVQPELSKMKVSPISEFVDVVSKPSVRSINSQIKK